MPSVTIRVEADVSLTDFDADDLVAEVESRGRVVLPSMEKREMDTILDRLYYALGGNSQQAINDAARELYNLLGDRIL